MKDIVLDCKNMQSVVHCGAGSFEKYAAELKQKYRLFVVTDANVFAIYRHLLWKTFGNDVPVQILVAGEGSKNKTNLFKILETMLKAGMMRGCCVVAFGGGVVGDIAGLAASLYMRGVHVVQIPTTLLSQVDSSVGGKTAIDLGKVKNAVGTFYQPEEVIVDPLFLKTLPPREIRCGLGEIIKYGALDNGILDKLTANKENLFSLDFLADITYDCIAHKAKVVTEDEHDLSGVRKKLNLGHTVGHALELKYGKKSHGEYVLIGMYYELFIAKKCGICLNEHAKALEELIQTVLLTIPVYDDFIGVGQLALHDKTNETNDEISLVVPVEKGVAEELKLPFLDLVDNLTECASYIKNGYLKKLALIGKDVSKSDSPAIHEFITKHFGNNIKYDRISLNEREFEEKIEGILAEYDGINVTIPYKLSIMLHLKDKEGDAVSFGVVNTVNCITRVGYNTDGLGFTLLLKDNNVDVNGKRVLLLGAGGAGRSVAKKLLEGGAHLFVYDKRRDNALALRREFGSLTVIDELPQDQPFYLIVNATGIGMHDTVGISPASERLLSCCTVALDLIYRPAKSEFLALAERQGKKIINGFGMLFYQAYFSDCIYFGKTPNEEQAKELYKQFLITRKEN